MKSENAERLERASALTGAAVWALMAGLAGAGKVPLGVIELLFLFAPLVVVPLGIALGRKLAPFRHQAVQDAARLLQPLAAGLVLISFWTPPGLLAAALAVPWLGLCVMLGAEVRWTLLRGRERRLISWGVSVGRMDLVVGSAWLLVSRLGMRPMNFQEPILLLTAVHFHYTGFATAVLAAALAAYSGKIRGGIPSLLRLVVVAVIGIPFVVAAGFVWSPILKLGAVAALSASVVVLAGWQFWLAARLSTGAARAFLRLSASAVFFGMVLATIYAVGDWLGRDWLLVPRMASTHGVVNGLGFVLFGLLGWMVELSAVGTKELEAGESPASTWEVVLASASLLLRAAAGPGSFQCPSR